MHRALCPIGLFTSQMTNYDSNRGLISFNSSTGHFDAQGIEVIGSYNERLSSPLQFIQSAMYSTQSGSLSVQFLEKGLHLVFPNTFVGFKNETIIICSPEVGHSLILVLHYCILIMTIASIRNSVISDSPIHKVYAATVSEQDCDRNRNAD